MLASSVESGQEKALASLHESFGGVVAPLGDFSWLGLFF